MVEAIGWTSSIILVLTLSKQVYKLWHEGSSQGVSRWLFLGQMAASFGFAVYSWIVENWIFIFTNSLMLVNGVLGYLIVLRHRRRCHRAERAPGMNALEELHASRWGYRTPPRLFAGASGCRVRCRSAPGKRAREQTQRRTRGRRLLGGLPS